MEDFAKQLEETIRNSQWLVARLKSGRFKVKAETALNSLNEIKSGMAAMDEARAKEELA